MTKKKEMKISAVKGRAMLQWIGKTPGGVVRHFPAQLREKCGVDTAAAEPEYGKFRDTKNGHNLLLHGDNKEVLASLLIGGFRGKVDLIYIDPPFASGADYVRTVKLRGMPNGNGNGNGDNGNGDVFTGAGQSAMEQTQYEDIWANDNYLQFMYERLILLRELLSERGSIYLHCDWRKSHYLRLLLDEVFGEGNFRNEIIWCYHDKFATGGKAMDKNHDTILHYSKSGDFIGNEIRIKKPQTTRRALRKKVGGQTVDIIDDKGEKIYAEYSDKKLDDVWTDIGRSIPNGENTGYPTQKKSELIERILQYGSNDNSLMLDCFCGSGTTAAVAQKLGRRWIAADMNKGAIQTTLARLQKIINEDDKNGGKLSGDARRGFAVYRVNNYDFAEEKALRDIIVKKEGIQTDRKDPFFDGVYDGELAYIAKLDKPLTKLDVQLVKDELQNRPDEARNIAVFCNGVERGLAADVAKNNKLKAINEIIIKDIQKKGVITFAPAEAEVTVAKRGKKAQVKIRGYVSHAILAKMDIQRSVFGEYIADFRAQIDHVLFDTHYDGKVFNIADSDMPKKKTDMIRGEYTLALPAPGATIAVKIVDMLGEETVIVK